MGSSDLLNNDGEGEKEEAKDEDGAVAATAAAIADKNVEVNDDNFGDATAAGLRSVMFVYRTGVQYVNILSAYFIFPCFSLNEKSSCLLQLRCRGVAGDNGVATASLPRHSDGERLILMNTVNKPPATTMCQHFLEILLVGPNC